jgi:hypothetical protein
MSTFEILTCTHNTYPLVTNCKDIFLGKEDRMSHASFYDIEFYLLVITFPAATIVAKDEKVGNKNKKSLLRRLCGDGAGRKR